MRRTKPPACLAPREVENPNPFTQAAFGFRADVAPSLPIRWVRSGPLMPLLDCDIPATSRAASRRRAGRRLHAPDRDHPRRGQRDRDGVGRCILLSRRTSDTTRGTLTAGRHCDPPGSATRPASPASANARPGDGPSESHAARRDRSTIRGWSRETNRAPATSRKGR